MKFIGKKSFIFFILCCLICIDIVVSKMKGTSPFPAVDTFFYESGSDEIDGCTRASIKAHVAIVKSNLSGLSFSKDETQELSLSEIREMVFKAIALDKHYGTDISELKYKISLISQKKTAPWIAIKPNLGYFPGFKHTPSDQEDPRIIWALLDYVADSTDAKRISLLAGGSYISNANETDIFKLSAFYSTSLHKYVRWNNYFPDLPDSFSLQSMLDSIHDRHPEKTIEGINLNYNEILQGGIPWNELTPADRTGKLPEIVPVPADSHDIGALPTANVAGQSGYNPTDAILNCDFLINIPKMKTTSDVVVNGIFKNYIGSVSRGTYGAGNDYPRDRSGSLSEIDHGALINTVLNLFSYHPTDYALIDATTHLEGAGPHPDGANTGFLRGNLIIAGGNPVATEAVAAATMNLNPNDIDMLRWAKAKGWGPFTLWNIAVYGSPLEEVRTDVICDFTGRGCRRWLLNGPYSAPDLSTAHIDEADADPRSGDTVNGLAWAAYLSSRDTVDVINAIPAIDNNGIVYAYTQIFSDKPQEGLMRIGGIQDIRVYLNGQIVIDTSGIPAYHTDNAVKNVSLLKGDNRILVKTRKSGSVCEFSVAIVNDGALSVRNSYIPHHGSTRLDPPISLTPDMKKTYFGGRTLFGTFYHLGQSDPIAMERKSPVRPALILSQNRPNPFNTVTQISFSIPTDLHQATLSLYDLSGKRLRTLFSGNTGPLNRMTLRWDGTDETGTRLPSGVYPYTLKAGNRTQTRRMIYVR